MTPHVEGLPVQAAHGFSLIELMVTLAVAGVMLMVAVPSFGNLMISSQLTGMSNELASALNVARVEAVKRNAPVEVCADSTCTVTARRASDGAQIQIRSGLDGLVPPIQARAVTHLSFSGQGLAYANGQTAPYSGLVADLFTDRLSTDNHRCVYMAVGAVVSTCMDSRNCAYSNGGPNASCH